MITLADFLTMNNRVSIIQCHSIGWEGSVDVSLRKDSKDRFVIEEVIERVSSVSNVTEGPIIACPDVPENRVYVDIAEASNAKVYFGSRDNVLERILGAAKTVGANEIAWCQGIHYFLDASLTERFLDWASKNRFDYARCVDGTLKQVLGQMVTVEALERARSLISLLPGDRQKFFYARPFAFMRERPSEFSLGLFEDLPEWSDSEYEAIRKEARVIYVEERATHDDRKAVAIGDASIARYRELLEYVIEGDKIVDVACGTGFGSRLMCEKGAYVTGVDIDESTVQACRERHGGVASFVLGSAEDIPLEDEAYDTVMSVATIEHVENDGKFVSEVERILKPGGRFVGYTPQNRMGNRPVWPWHVREYSPEALRSVLETQLVVEKILGWQNGVITEDDPRGDGSIFVARKRA